MTVLYISGTNFPSDIVLKMLFLFTSASDIVIMINAISLLKISRPGLWLVFVWLYLWPTGGFYTLLHSLKFWMGLLYCTFPLNFLVYGMNDLADEDVDSQNPRKGNFIYGAKITKGQRRNLPLQIALVNITAGCVLGICSNDWVYIFCWTSSAVCINFFYNNEPFRLSRKCPWELPCMIVGHFLIPLLSCRLNQVPFPSFFSWLFNGLLLARSHIWLEFADIDVDKGSDKRTIAVFLGKCTTLRLVVLITLIEASVGFLLLKSTLVGLFSLLGVFVFCTSSAQGAQNKVHVSVSQSLVGMTSIVDSLRPVASFFTTATGRRSKTERISLTIRLWDVAGKITAKDTPFSIHPDSPLKNILRIYAVREAVFPNCYGHLRFMVESRVLSEDESANDLRLSDGDCIDAIPCVDDMVGSRFV